MEQVKQLKRIRHLFVLALVTLIILVFGLCGFYKLDVEHSAVVTTFGKPTTITKPGPKYRFPIVQKLTKVDMTTKGMGIGYDPETDEDIPSESVMISSDYNFLNVDFYLEYRVSDPIKYLYASNNPEQILRAVAQNCIRTVIASYKVDSIITTGKSEIQSNIKSMLITKMDDLDIGLEVRSIVIQDSKPPTADVIAAFEEVENARQAKTTLVTEANKYRNEQIPKAEADVDQILQKAEATKANRIAEAEGQVARFNDMYAEYVKYPSITKQRMFYETMEDILPSMKVVIQGEESDVQTMLPLEQFSN